ncbi:hypothetical protein Glove_117g328 [Diversispora epigaea]|uniref:RlpA-like protein double-psi beta-barrel domain-containing protein n=1 Tax=Diversispora epigaea TaxID=1348612 RepID=A0A397J585_9GLOM|nr:hypothetical protein Glove_117g328 [Diversispora epigaea]
MISFQKSAVLFFALALAVMFMLETASAGVIYRAIAKRDYEDSDSDPDLETSAKLINGVFKGKTEGDATFYGVGLGACGFTNTNDEMIFAMPAVMFDPSPNGNPYQNPNCGKEAIVTRRVGGVKKRVRVICVDRCVGCKYGDIDLSPAAFNMIASPDEGRVKVEVRFTGKPPRGPKGPKGPKV